DVWFVGMTPDLVAGVWIGFDQPKPILAGASGGTLATPVWASVMKAAHAGRRRPVAWAPPPSLASVRIDVHTGKLATSACPPVDTRIEYFAPGTEPTDHCPTHSQGLLD